MALITITDPITFGGLNLNSVTGWMTTATTPYRYGKRDVKRNHIAYTNRSKASSAFHTSKTVNIQGVIRVPGRELLDASISELERILAPVNQELRLPIAGEQRKYREATVENIIYTDTAGGYTAVDIEFGVSERYNYAINTTEILNVVNLTSGNKSYPVTFEGTGQQAPVFRYTVDSFTNGSNKTVTISNPTTGLSIVVQRTWTAAEVLTIDCLNRTIQVNGEDVNFTGNFLEWSKGAGFINYSDTFTARQVDLNVTYTKRYY